MRDKIKRERNVFPVKTDERGRWRQRRGNKSSVNCKREKMNQKEGVREHVFGA